MLVPLAFPDGYGPTYLPAVVLGHKCCLHVVASLATRPPRPLLLLLLHENVVSPLQQRTART